MEDDPVISQLIGWRLEKLGYEVTGRVQTGKAALHLIEEKPPDLILIDIMLKGEMDGIDLAKRVKQRYRIPFVYLTAYSDSETIARVIDTEPRGFLRKPFNDEDLKVAIELAIRKATGESR